MSLKKFLTSREFVKHLIAAILLIIIVIVITFQGLKKYTRHGQSTPVPDFFGLTISELEELALQKNLKFEIIDSIFFTDALPGTVVDQEPEAGFKVKENHTIFLTINSSQPEKVVLPKLTDISFRQVQVLAENCGIEIGNISYEPSEFNDLVLRVEQDSVEVFPGEMVLKGSRIDLIVGREGGNEATTLPDLTGIMLSDAKFLLTNSMLNMGVIIYDETVFTSEDSVNAMVWKQYPSTKNTKSVNLGTSVDLWFTTDTMKIEKPVLTDTEENIW